jgi:signal transduction histidine kinase/ActR/RegA family two-component response regulator
MKESSVPVFLSGGGEVGALMRTHDWSTSPLGAPAQWPQSLRAVVGLILNSKFPMFVAWGPELGFLYNDPYAEILGGKHPSALGRPFQVIWQEIWSDIHPIIVEALDGQSSYHSNLPLMVNRKGFDEEAWFTFSYSPVRDESGAIAGMYCAVSETTIDVLNQRHRLKENERLRMLFAQAPGVMAVLREPDHVFELANAAYLELVGNREVEGKDVRKALPELEGQGFFELLDKVYASGEPYKGQGVSVKLQRGPGQLEERFIDFVYQPIKDASGKVTGIFVEGYDVTAAVSANNELRAANRRKDEFLAMLAHELRNPLAPISSAADLLRLAGPQSELVRQTSAIISRQVRHMTGLVDDLLDVSRVTRGLISLQKETLDLNAVVADALEQVRGLIQSRHQHLDLQLPSDPPALVGDRMRLVQVFANILNNAAKYTPEHGHISVRLDVRQDAIHFSVQDDGAGMTPDLLPHVFDLFSQAERSPDRSQGGLGLGLALVKSLVELHDGDVTAQSDGPGRGSLFVVRLPRVEMPAPTKKRQGNIPGIAPTETPLRLMVVDDNADAAEVLRLLLEALGHDVVIEHDARRAIERAPQYAPQMLFLDIGLPDMDGYELVRHLRGLPETADATFVAVTGYGQPDDKARARDAGFDHHVVKPVKLPAILALLDAVAGAPESG